MYYVKSLSEYQGSTETAVTFGKFDGLHKGHRKLVEKVSELGRKENIRSVVCTFDMRAFYKERGIGRASLMTGSERYDHLKNLADCLIECPFTEKIRNISAENFIRDIIAGLFHARYVVVGTDFRFGHNQGGDIHMLERYAEACGYTLIVIEKERYEGKIISSTRIRETLEKGDMELAGKLLGYPFEVNGTVGHGRRLGRNLGFPTLNIVWPEDKFIPPRGVYMSEIILGGIRYHGISNVGVRPTVSEDGRVVLETFLFDYDGDAYGEKVKIELLAFRRPEHRFDSVGEMKACVDRDIAYGRKYFGMDGMK